ncbi:hypothetical protein [Microbacterium sp. 2FI]|uniref:hypothetical protein n=1 Tax=Microbacterium sp. 2FI TaxID=2502193 RepID=UPI0010F47FD4|nr:hypothetical protein [Microbacterium sp. 2FI]
MTGAADEGGPVRPAAALALATVSFVALLIFGLGMTSLVLGADVIETPGLGQVPGILGVALATAAFAGSLWLTLRRNPASYGGAAWTAAAVYLAYLGGVAFGILFSAGELAVAASVAGRIAVSWFGAVVAGAAAIAAWGGIALVRTRAQRPRWPWEDDFDE